MHNFRLLNLLESMGTALRECIYICLPHQFFSIFAQFLDWSIKVPNSTVELRLKLFVYWLIVKIVTDLLQCTVFY